MFFLPAGSWQGIWHQGAETSEDPQGSSLPEHLPRAYWTCPELVWCTQSRMCLAWTWRWALWAPSEEKKLSRKRGRGEDLWHDAVQAGQVLGMLYLQIVLIYHYFCASHIHISNLVASGSRLWVRWEHCGWQQISVVQMMEQLPEISTFTGEAKVKVCPTSWADKELISTGPWRVPSQRPQEVGLDNLNTEVTNPALALHSIVLATVFCDQFNYI